MFKNKTKIIIAINILFSILTLSWANAEDIFEIKYIKNISSNKYEIMTSNAWNDLSKIKFYIDWKEMPYLKKTLKSDWTIELSDFPKNNWSIYLEKTTEIWNADWTKSTKVDKSNTINFRNESTISLKQNVIKETKWWINMVLLSFNKDIADYIWAKENSSLDIWLSLNINWTDVTLTKETWWVYENTKYYFNNNYIYIPYVLLKDPINKISLKVDSALSNYVIINKENYKIEKPLETYIENASGTKNIRFKIQVPEVFPQSSNLETYINWTKLDAWNVTLWQWVAFIKQDILKFTKDDKIAEIYFKNIADNTYSNKLYVNIDSLIWNNITKLDLWKNIWANFTFIIYWTDWSYVWDLEKIKININWIDYTKSWVKEYTKSSTWMILKDWFWNDMYEIKNKLDFYSNWPDLKFNYLYANLLDWENVVYVKNDNNWRVSNKVSFTKWTSSNINYLYLTWSDLNSQNSSKESITFDKWTELLNKTIDFLNKNEKDIILWKINFNNLKPNEMYSIWFKLKTSVLQDFFNEIKLDKYYLIPEIKNNKTEYTFEYRWLWKNITSANLNAILNESFNIKDSNVKMTIENMYIKRLNEKNETEDIYPNDNSYIINFAYKYSFNWCFDWEKDYCVLWQMKDTSLLINLSYWTETIQVQQDTSLENVEVTSELNALTNLKKNTEIVELDFKNESYKKINLKFIKFYNLLKTKKIEYKYINAWKKAINRIIYSLKDIEEWKNKSDALKTIKTNVKALVTILKMSSK